MQATTIKPVPLSGLLAVCMLSACMCVSESRVPREGATVLCPVQAERDEIFTLLAYAVALEDWQANDAQRRGYNIAAVLVNPEGDVVHWARNSNHRTQNATQHAEVRVIQGYLATARSYHLSDYTVYTTLEPCAQCAGMMMLTRIKRTVYGQSDPDFGQALGRMSLDTRKLPELLPEHYARGYGPYPRQVQASRSELAICEQLDQAHAESGLAVPDFLHTDQARRLFQVADEQLRGYEPGHAENEVVLRDAINFLDREVATRR